MSRRRAARWPRRTRGSSRCPRPKRRSAVVGTLSTQVSPAHEIGHYEQPTDERGTAPDLVDQRPDHEHERVHPEHMRADDREDRLLRVVVVLDDDVAGQVHDGDHHAEARDRGQHRRDHTRPPQDLAERRGVGWSRLSADRGRSAPRSPSCRAERSSASPHVTSDRPAAASQGPSACRRRRPCLRRAARRASGPRTAPKTEPKRTNEMPRARRSGGYMSPAAVLIRSVTAPAIPANAKPVIEREPRAPVGADGSEAVADRAEEETDDDHRDAAEAVHGAPGWEGGQSRGGQEDRRACTEQRPESGHEDERQGQHRGAELQDCRVERLDDRQGRGVSRDREVLLRQAQPARLGTPERRRARGAGSRPSRAQPPRPGPPGRRGDPRRGARGTDADASISVGARAAVGQRARPAGVGASGRRSRAARAPSGRAPRARGGRSSRTPRPGRSRSAAARR